jgi:hypothetical protein
VLARAFQHQPRRASVTARLKPMPTCLRAAEVGAGQRVGVAQVVGRAVEHDLAAALARARAHVDHAVGRQHHGGSCSTTTSVLPASRSRAWPR